MSPIAHDSARLNDLRLQATSRLKGDAAVAGAHTQAASALSVLMTWASSSDTAADALTLLHELQVHQVELDLQAEELRDSRIELEADLRRQAERYDWQPVACFTVDASLLLQDLNRAAAGLLGLPAAEALGLGLDVFCSPESAALLRQQVSASLQAETPAATRLALGPQGAAPQPFWAQFGLDAEGKHCFVVLVQSH